MSFNKCETKSVNEHLEDSEYSAEEGKRKREKDIEIFRKSKKTGRSPKKADLGTSYEMEEMKQMMESIFLEIQEMRRENKQYLNEMNQLRQENKEMRCEISKLANRMDYLEEKAERLEDAEKRKKKNNLVITGVTDKQEGRELTLIMERFIEKNLEIKGSCAKLEHHLDDDDSDKLYFKLTTVVKSGGDNICSTVF
ncbi:hypothetical protein FQR65_LT09470 [Abscondita terminalis]|nr:hypothetical protein FQR65_LT09470 [Abscondita terminalis]